MAIGKFSNAQHKVTSFVQESTCICPSFISFLFFRQIHAMKNPRYALIHRTGNQKPSMLEVVDLQKNEIVKRITLVCILSKWVLIN